MSETYRMSAEPTGEPLPPGRVGVCVRIGLSGFPSERWSRALTSHLVNQLTRHPGGGHLRLKNTVRADQIAVEGVEARRATPLGACLRRATDATNDTMAR